MGYWTLLNKLEFDRKNKRRKILLLIINLIIIALLAFSYNFLVWVIILSGITVLFIVLFLLSLFRIELITRKPHSSLKLFISRLLGIVIGIGGLYLFIFKLNISNYFLDIPYYVKQDYQVVYGKPLIQSNISHTNSSRGFAIQWVHVGGIKLENHILLKIKEYENKNVTFYYLPHSKFVVEIWEEIY